MYPPVPPLTRYKEAVFPMIKKKVVENVLLEEEINGNLVELTVSKLCIRLNTLQVSITNYPYPIISLYYAVCLVSVIYTLILTFWMFTSHTLGYICCSSFFVPLKRELYEWFKLLKDDTSLAQNTMTKPYTIWTRFMPVQSMSRVEWVLLKMH